VQFQRIISIVLWSMSRKFQVFTCDVHVWRFFIFSPLLMSFASCSCYFDYFWKNNDKKCQSNLGRAASPPLMTGNELARCVCYLCNAHCRRVQSLSRRYATSTPHCHILLLYVTLHCPTQLWHSIFTLFVSSLSWRLLSWSWSCIALFLPSMICCIVHRGP